MAEHTAHTCISCVPLCIPYILQLHLYLICIRQISASQYAKVSLKVLFATCWYSSEPYSTASLLQANQRPQPNANGPRSAKIPSPTNQQENFTFCRQRSNMPETHDLGDRGWLINEQRAMLQQIHMLLCVIALHAGIIRVCCCHFATAHGICEI